MEMTLFNCDWRELSKADLNVELRCQKNLRMLIYRELNDLKRKSDTKKPSRIREDKIEFFDDYLKLLDGEIAEMEERYEIMSDKGFDTANSYRKRITTSRRNRRKDDKRHAVRRTDYDGINLSWDKEKFMLVAKDRGYLTEASVLHAVGEELAASREKAKVLLEKGKFTFGQVLCLGAMLQMTPREFCDVFLSGYFVEYYGRYIASYENMDKRVLLQRASAIASKKELKELDAFAEQLKEW